MIEQLRKWITAKRTHILAWSIFIVYELSVVGLSQGGFEKPIIYISAYTCVISLFYAHAMLGMPWANKRSRYIFWRLVLAIMIALTLYVAVKYIFDTLLDFIHAHSSEIQMENSVYFAREIYRGTYFIGASTGYYYIRNYINERKRSADLEMQRLNEIIYRRIAEEETVRSQNAFLMAQINPHFLFNTLDYLYHNTLSLDPKLADAVISLSGMMRFAIDADKMGSTIRLGDEIEQIENLVYLHQVRQKLWIELSVSEQTTELPIIPLVLLTFTENVLKHGYLRDSDKMARIEVYSDNEYLHIQTINSINHIASKTSSLTGLANISKRLEIAYPNQFTFTYGPVEAKTFRVHLSIELSALEQTGAFSYHSTNIGKE